jgi:hypothetical protein
MNGMLKRLGLSLLVCAGPGSAAWAQAPSPYDGQYVGQMTLTGIIRGDCMTPPAGALYPLEIRGGIVRFKYVPRFDTVLMGKVDARGNIRAGINLKSGIVSMAGHIDAGNVTAEIDSPSCHYVFSTKQ